MDIKQFVTIQGVPRSGTSWLGQIFRSSPHVAFRFQPLFSYAYKDRLSHTSSRAEILQFFNDILLTKDPFVLQQDPNIHVDYPQMEEAEAPTHLVMKEVRYNHIIRNLLTQLPELKVICLVRHPCAVIHSWIKAPKEFDHSWNVLEQWRSGALKNRNRPEEFFGFDKWKEVACLFLELQRMYPENVKVVRYEDLLAETSSVVKQVFAFCDLQFGSQTEKFIDESKSKQGTDPNSVYRLKSSDDQWKGELNETIANTIQQELIGGPLSYFL